MTEIRKTQLPVSKITKIAKISLDGGQGMSGEASRLLTFATVSCSYISLLMHILGGICKNARFICLPVDNFTAQEDHPKKGHWYLLNILAAIRNGVSEKCIQRDWIFTILENALDDWPEPEGETMDTENASSNNAAGDPLDPSAARENDGAAEEDEGHFENDDDAEGEEAMLEKDVDEASNSENISEMNMTENPVENYRPPSSPRAFHLRDIEDS